MAGDIAKGPSPTTPFSKVNRYFDPDLKGAAGRVSVLVAVDATASSSEVLRLLGAPRVLPAIGDARLIRGTIDAPSITELQSLPSVLAVLEDRPMAFGGLDKPAVDPRIPTGTRALAHPEPSVLPREPLGGAPEVTMRDVVNFTGARNAWTKLGVDGTGVTIAIVDTGVDLGAFNLGNRSAARDASGLPTSLDPDGSTFAFTTIRLSSYMSGTFTFVNSSGTNPVIYVFDLFGAFGPYGPHILSWSGLFGGPFPRDMNITGLPPSLSGTYHFGVLFEWHLLPNGFPAIDLFPALVIDSRVAGVYDTAYLDLSFDAWLNGFLPSPDFSFSDEPRLRPAGGNVVAARDLSGDGYPDISAGSLANFLDIWGLSPDPTTRFGVLKPLDPKGNHLAMVYDWEGHGSSVAASAAGRESNHPLAGPGIAPGARIMGVPVFAWGDIIEGWLWAAGFDLVGVTMPVYVPNYIDIVRYGNWAYTGNHKADIISNSWGVSDWLSTPFFAQWAWYDVLTVFEDALMTPGYANPNYPGTLMVHAGGNGASGYGTVTEPGFSSLAITVGASTSMNWTRLLWGSGGGFHNDVMSWSARGPNALGAPKPDLVNVGAFAWTAGPVWSGYGNGANAFTLFGGTSQATPVTSGSAAVVIQAYRSAHGSSPSPFVVKSILKSTAIDLGYDAFVQGAGQVNVYNAAAYAIAKAGILVSSHVTWDNLRPRLTLPWAQASVFYGQQVGVAPPQVPINDTSWFAGSVHPGTSTSAAFSIEAAGGSVSGTISAVWHTRLTSVLTISTTTTTIPGWLEGYGNLTVLAPSAIPASADLMVVRGIMPYNYLDSNGDYNWDNRSRIIVGDWVDANADGVPQIGEVHIFNYGYNTGTTVEARVGFPTVRFAGKPLLWFSQAPRAGHTFVPMPVTITVEFYQRVTWPWITVPSTFSASPGSPATWSANLAVPAGANPGVYEGQIIVAPTTGNVTVVPVSVVVPRVIGPSTLSAPLTSTGSTQIYNPSSVDGYFDWQWRYEAGDWKLWFVDVTDPTTVALRTDVSWTGSHTDIDIWSITPSGIPGDSSFSPSLGSGRFLWYTRTNTTADYVTVQTNSGLDQSAPGLYTFALHNVLFGGGPTREALTGTVSAAKLNPRGPVTIVTQPGKTVSVPFTLSTGFNLDGVFVALASPPQFSAFPATTEPGFVPLVGAGTSLAAWANVTVPAGTVDGAYSEYVVFFANEISSGVIVRVNVIVDSTSPAVSLLAPTANAQLRGTVTLSAATADANNVASVSFAAGSASGPMVRDPVTGMWTATWDTTGTADGTNAIAVTATDAAGNIATSSRGVVVDNTPPTAAFSSPPGNAWVRGATHLAFSTADANLKSATLSFGGTSADVTGLSTYDLDTRTLSDGAQTLTLMAVDLAGNVRTVSLALNVDNTPPVAVLTSLEGGSFVRGSPVVSFVATDANVANATLTIGTQSYDVKGKSSQTIATASIADGLYTLTLTVTDLAGNPASASMSVVVDNTAPQVTISAPAANANLRGTTTISWSASDANPLQVWLVIDGQARDVTGTTSYAWNTNTAGDGTHTIVVRAVDKAGNQQEATVSVTTDNVAVASGNAMTTGLTQGLIIGLIVAAVAGFLFGFVLGRRGKPKSPHPQEVPPPPRSNEEL